MIASQLTAPARGRGVRRARFAARVLLLAWAGFWTWFVVAVGLSEGLAAAPYALAFVASFTVLVVAAWRSERIGGLLLAGAGVFAFFFFAGASARQLLALPALALGALFLALSWSQKRDR